MANLTGLFSVHSRTISQCAVMENPGPMSDSERLRERARRYRELAASSPWERSLGKALADHFDRLAEKAEKAEGKLVAAAVSVEGP